MQTDRQTCTSSEQTPSKAAHSEMKPLEYTGSSLILLDQRLLPREEKYIECLTSTQVIESIREMVVRGAPAIGFAGAWACCLAAKEENNEEKLLEKFEEIKSARPTAVNLMKAVDRLKAKFLASKDAHEIKISILEQEAQLIYDEDAQMCQLMASFGLMIIGNRSEYNFITHCNTGSLATAGLGTALGIVKLLAKQQKKVHVYATETRPYLQGARLTSWELNKCQIPVTLMPDSAAAYIMQTKKIHAVFVGADRVVANGDTANKVGTYMLALCAQAHNIPFYVVAPSTSFDLSLASGKEIEIEQRSIDELIEFNGLKIAPDSIDCFNPGFDITPGNLITGFITEKGVLSIESLKRTLGT